MSTNDSQKTILTIVGIVAGIVLLGPYLGYNLLGNGPEGAARVAAPAGYSGAADAAQTRRDNAARDSREIEELTRKPAPDPIRKDTGKGSGKLSEIENLLR